MNLKTTEEKAKAFISALHTQRITDDHVARHIACFVAGYEDAFKDGYAEGLKAAKHDAVNRPAHYTTGKIEVIDFIEDKQLPFHLGNVVKYIARAGKKDVTREIEDLQKAEWYLHRYLANKGAGTNADTFSRSLIQVEEFHNAYGHPVLHTPVIPSAERAALRIRLLREELDELDEAIAAGDLTECVDAIADLQYVLDGTVLEFGLKEIMREVSDEVHRSNMSKLGVDGKPITRKDGKTLKGPNFTPPDINAILSCFADYQAAKEDGEVE